MVEYRSATGRDGFGGRINRTHSPFVARMIPWASIIIASILPIFPIMASMPLLPPVGFIVLIAWRLVRPGLLPVWAGLPLGFVDDLFSGQPFGNAMLLWSLTLIALEIFETRVPWRGFAQDWLVGSAAIAVYIIVCALIAGASVGGLLSLLAPQLILSILLYPMFGRLVAFLDRFRLRRFRTIG